MLVRKFVRSAELKSTNTIRVCDDSEQWRQPPRRIVVLKAKHEETAALLWFEVRQLCCSSFSDYFLNAASTPLCAWSTQGKST